MSPTLRHYACGTTRHRLRGLLRGAPRGRREFPAGVFLYDDGARRLLFDTGYPAGRWRGWRAAAYRTLLPPRIRAADTAAARLRADGVDPGTIGHIVLSHLHPDHIGGVADFPDATFVLARGQLDALARPRLAEAVLTTLLPAWFQGARHRVLEPDDFAPHTVAGVALDALDLFGDGALLALALPGHARGHLGLLVEGRVLLAGDAAWGSDLLGLRMRALPRRVLGDPDAAQATAAALLRIRDAGVRVVCSHDPVEARELLA